MIDDIQYPQIYYEIAMKYPCIAEDLFRAAPFMPDHKIEMVAQLMAVWFPWWQVRMMISCV